MKKTSERPECKRQVVGRQYKKAFTIMADDKAMTASGKDGSKTKKWKCLLLQVIVFPMFP